MFRSRLDPPRLAASVGCCTVIALLSACSSGAAVDPASASSSSVAAALSSAAQASPGEYGVPVNPSLPNPTAVATDGAVPTPTSETATMVLTFAAWDPAASAFEAGAFVQGVVETGGTCTLTATGPGSGTLTSSSPAEPDADSTTCPSLSLPGGDLAAGNWSIQVLYASATVRGQSDPTTVVVP